jgi:6-pyruvoyltetrahydropterin/6-carboxytetrahydropterin synthase
MHSNPTTNSAFEVRVTKDYFKFNAAHFVAYRGYRERLHGHNYTVSVRLLGSNQISNDGYLLDFGFVKNATRRVCKELNEHFLCPMLSNVLQIKVDEKNITITCEDGAVFMLPKDDCIMLPIVHATTEELAVYLWDKILQGLDASVLRTRQIHTLEVAVSESTGQGATFRKAIPEDSESNSNLSVFNFIRDLSLHPSPCLSEVLKDEKAIMGNATPCVDPLNDANSAPHSKPFGSRIVDSTTEKPPCCNECCNNCLTNQLSKKLELIAKAAKNTSQIST